MYDLTGFQRDLLTVTAGIEEPHGLAIYEHANVHMAVAGLVRFEDSNVLPILNVSAIRTERPVQRRSDVISERVNHIAKVISWAAPAVASVFRRARQRQHHDVRVFRIA